MGPLLASDPTLATNVAEESLRFEAAVQMDPARIASQDIEIGGHTFRQGERLLLLYGAGNRDPQQYENPDVFDIRRPNIRPLTLGGSRSGTGPARCPRTTDSAASWAGTG